MGRARGANASFLGGFETAYGSGQSAAFMKLPIVTENLGEEQGLLEDDLLGQGRESAPPTLDVINNEGDVSIPVDLRAVGVWLKGLMGAPQTVASVAAAGSYAFSGQPAAASTVTINGTAFTFVATSPTGNQVQLGANLAATMTALAAALNASAVTGVALATYTGTATGLTILHDTLGPAGNAFTLAASATSNATLSGATLAGGANDHVFVSGAADLPSLVLEAGNPEVPSFGLNFGAAVNMMKIGLARSGQLNAMVSIIAQGETLGDVTVEADPDEFEIERFAQFSGGITRNGVAMGEIVSAEWSYANNLDKIEVIRSDGRIAGVDPGKVKLGGQIVSRFSTTDLLTQAANGQPCDLSYGWSKGRGKALKIDNHAVYLPRAKRPITGPAGVQVTYPWQGAKDVILGKSCTITLTNDVASYA